MSGAYIYPQPAPNADAYVSNGLNQIASLDGAGLTYDARGNLTSAGGVSYTYDAFNRLTVAGPLALVYDPAGRLYETTASGATTRFLYDGLQAIAEYNTSGALVRRYVPGIGLDEHLVWYEGSGTSDRRWIVQDDLGSVVAVTNSSGANLSIKAYDEYGQPASGNAGTFGYTGQMYLAQAGLYHYRARTYSPSLGRFMQTDPIGYAGGLNLYAYVQNDPVNFADPSGLRVFLAARQVQGVGVHYFVVVDRGAGDVTIFSYGPANAEGNPGLLVPSAMSPDRTNEDDFDAYSFGDDLIGIRELYVPDDAAVFAGEAVDDLVLNAECRYNFWGAWGGCNSNSGVNLLLHLLGYEFVFGPLGGGVAPGWDQWNRLLTTSSGCPQGVPGGDLIVCGERTSGGGGASGGLGFGMGGTLGMGSRPMPGGGSGGMCQRMPCYDPTSRPPRTR